jgi:transposase
MKVVSLDLHAETSQMFVTDQNGKVLQEGQVATQRRALREAVGAIEGDKCVVFEEGPLSVLVKDALQGVAEQVVSCDPAYNALIALDENHSDQRDARHLEKLFRLKAVRPVYVPGEPFLSLRSLLSHRLSLQRQATMVKNRIQALARRSGLRGRGKRLYKEGKRREAVGGLLNDAIRWQMQSLWRELDLLEEELSATLREVRGLTRGLGMVERLQSIPGVGLIVAGTVAAWIVDPHRFKNQSALNAYAGLGMGQAVTNWEPQGGARASRRGNRHLKRVLFLAAGVATRTESGLGDRYRCRRRQGWTELRSKRDVARKILHIACALWRKGARYEDSLVNGAEIGVRG